MAIILVIIGGAFRVYFVQNSLDDWDEDEYIIAAKSFRNLYDAEEWSKVPEVTTNKEHPPLVKMLYAFTLDEEEFDQIPRNHFPGTRAEPPLPRNSLENARLQSVAFGVLTIFIVGWISPLAGVVLVFHTLFLRFTTAAYLDALPTFFSALAVIFYTRASLGQLSSSNTVTKIIRKFPNTYWFLSGACMGIAVAAKYPYGLIAVILVLHAIFSRYNLLKIATWGVVALIFFFIFNPYIWSDPISRVDEQLSYHADYAERNGEQHNYLKPFEQLVTPRQIRHRQSDFPFLPFQIFEIIVLGLAAIGLVVLLRYKSVMGLWLLIGMIFLVLWSTQWVQHKMMIMVPYSFAAAAGFQWLNQKITQRRQHSES